ncbi:hypothetical protein GCG54_00014334 [Colletotrichum gloeosporioides]|uniref:Uncharacterized protein n=1 Tax=Colletotrichum gloeosporioides TaxID=474922 RepID=A0A8H4CF52_COLGL|nr:uncharacterized protein GCG54_00014334 [Colletotrichum gloeosporioides]KAF3802627.1 hypothetical protein GCG54_00014334 [Colletotrichum gloeosporioides]
MKITSLVSFLAVTVVMAQACDYCQCQKSDGSHCCVAHANGKACDEVCKTAVYSLSSNGDRLSCNAGGASNCISPASYSGRDRCIVGIF